MFEQNLPVRHVCPWSSPDAFDELTMSAGGCDGDGSCGDGQSGSVGCGH